LTIAFSCITIDQPFKNTYLLACPLIIKFCKLYAAEKKGMATNIFIGFSINFELVSF